MIEIRFEFDSPYGVYKDTLLLVEDHGLTDGEIDALKLDRFNSWLALITAPVTEEAVDG